MLGHTGHASDPELEHVLVPQTYGLLLHFLEVIIQLSPGVRASLATLLKIITCSIFAPLPCIHCVSFLNFLSLPRFNLLCTYFSVSLHKNISSVRAAFFVLFIAVCLVFRTVSGV